MRDPFGWHLNRKEVLTHPKFAARNKTETLSFPLKVLSYTQETNLIKSASVSSQFIAKKLTQFTWRLIQATVSIDIDARYKNATCKPVWKITSKSLEKISYLVEEPYSVNRGMSVEIMEQTRDTYLGGGVIPAVMPRLRTNSKYSREAINTAAATAIVNTHPPANTIPPETIPIAKPNTTRFLSWSRCCCRNNCCCWSELESSACDNVSLPWSLPIPYTHTDS